MPQLNLIRAAAHDVASARAVLLERIHALEAIVQAALDHGVTPAEVARAREAALPTPRSPAEHHSPMLMA